jgi:hypothetical protein
MATKESSGEGFPEGNVSNPYIGIARISGTMETVDSARRDLLRLGSMGLAASAFSAVPALAAPKKAAGPTASPLMFDVRGFGAVGDGKAVAC